jgi:glycosyltransferase involved in cell wall biosynthesis
VTSQWPGAVTSGAQQRIFSIGALLKQVCDLDLIVVDRYDHEHSYREPTERYFSLIKVIATPHTPKRGIRHRLRHELDPMYPFTTGRIASAADRAFVTGLLPSYDFVWIHKIDTANAIGLQRWPKSILDIDDRPSQVYGTRASVATNLWSRVLDTRSRILWSRRERALKSRFDHLLVCSEDDRRALGLPRVSALPNGFDVQHRVNGRERAKPYVGFVGTFDWWPNVDGVQWFISEVWPLIRERVPDAHLRLVGKDSEKLGDRDKDIDGLGFVDDVSEEVSTWSVLIVPIRGGGGTRIKLLEAFARGVPAVATTFGAYGYDVVDGDELFIADEPAMFAERCVQIVQSSVLAREMAERAHTRFVANWTWQSYLPRVRSIIEQVAGETRPPS